MSPAAELAIERYAEALRAEAGQDALPVDVRLVASVLGVRVRRVRTSDFAGRLHARPDGRLVVDVNAADEPARQRFSVAHELMHTAFPGFVRGPGGRPAPFAARPPAREEERLCDAGAAALLMPDALVHGRFELADGLIAVEALARAAGVSLEAAANRLVALPGPPAALVVLERMHKPGDRGPLAAGGHVPRRLRVRYARTRDLEVFLPRFAPAARTSAPYRALSQRPQRARERLPGDRHGALFDVEARAYGSTRRGLVIVVATPARACAPRPAPP